MEVGKVALLELVEKAVMITSRTPGRTATGLTRPKDQQQDGQSAEHLNRQATSTTTRTSPAAEQVEPEAGR